LELESPSAIHMWWWWWWCAELLLRLSILRLPAKLSKRLWLLPPKRTPHLPWILRRIRRRRRVLMLLMALLLATAPTAPTASALIPSAAAPLPTPRLAAGEALSASQSFLRRFTARGGSSEARWTG
jgi:hypothetical protein